MDPNAGEPIKPGGTTPDISRVEGLVAAAQQEAAARTTPKAQFENQFGSPTQATTPPVVNNVAGAGLIDTALANLGTPQQTQPPAAETLASEPEQTPAERLKRQIADSVDAFLKEMTKEEVAV